MNSQYFAAKVNGLKRQKAAEQRNADKWGFQDSINHRASVAKLNKAIKFYEEKCNA
jgi:hypothetical protein